MVEVSVALARVADRVCFQRLMKLFFFDVLLQPSGEPRENLLAVLSAIDFGVCAMVSASCIVSTPFLTRLSKVLMGLRVSDTYPFVSSRLEARVP